MRLHGLSFGFTVPVIHRQVFIECPTVARSNKSLDWVKEDGELLIWLGPIHAIIELRKFINGRLTNEQEDDCRINQGHG